MAERLRQWFGRVGTMRIAGIGILLALFLVCAAAYDARSLAAPYPELDGLARESPMWNFDQLSSYFRRLAEDKGGRYAFDVLSRAALPPGVDFHLLAHVIGDSLYKQQGIAGMSVCTQDFRNACSHSIVINALLTQGESVLPKLAEVCTGAPGGAGAYTMCFHGLGHGVLAYVGYELPKAIELCKRIGTPAYHDEEYYQCVGGTIMEIISGVHDKVAWEAAAKKYFHEDDPLYPCTAPFMPREVQPFCYIYLTPHLFEVAGASLALPTPTHFKKAFEYCERIPEHEQQNRKSCFGGPGKEFIVLARAHDIRNVDQSSDRELAKAAEWCGLAGSAETRHYCDEEAASSLYWGGENDPDAALRFCSLVDETRTEACFGTLFEEARRYAQDPAAFCSLVPETYSEKCRKEIGV